MKYFIFSLVFGLFVIQNAVSAPISASKIENAVPPVSIIDAIGKALNSGDASAVAQFFGPKVQISIGDSENTLEKAKALEALKAFFSTHKPSGYAPMHSGKSKEHADQYMIGNLTTSNGVFRVYIYIKTTPTSQTIQEIRFDQ